MGKHCLHLAHCLFKLMQFFFSQTMSECSQISLVFVYLCGKTRRRELGKNAISFRVKTLLDLTRTPSVQNIRAYYIYIFISALFTPLFFL